MAMDGNHSVEPSKVVEAIAANDVLTLRFVTVGRRLLLDFRATDIDGPLVRLVDPVKSAKQRFRMLAAIRPRFEAPEKIVSIWWPRFIGSLDDCGIRDAILRRVAEAGHPDAVRAAEEALRALAAEERAHQRDAVAGPGFKTLWSASARRP